MVEGCKVVGYGLQMGLDDGGRGAYMRVRRLRGLEYEVNRVTGGLKMVSGD